MAATMRETTPRELIAEAKEFVWRKRLGNYSIREIAGMVSEHIGRPVGKSTVSRWVSEGERGAVARAARDADTRRIVELGKLDEMERRVQLVMDKLVIDETGDDGEPLRMSVDGDAILRASAMKLRIMERRAKYLGDDAPTQITGELSVAYRLVSDGQVDDEALT